MKTFSLEIGNLDFSVEECNYREINCIIMNLWEEEKNDFLSQISEGLEIKDRDRCIARLHSIGKSIIDECIREGIVKTLVNNHIYTYDFQQIVGRYKVYKNCNNVVENLSEKYDEINLDNKKAHEYRQLRKDTRGRWKGGGFGISGALKGAAKAGVMNGVTGAGHSIGNAIGNAYSDYTSSQKINEVFTNPGLSDDLYNAIQKDVENLVAITVEILTNNGMRVKQYTTADIRKGIGIYNNYKLIDDLEEKKEALKQCFKSNPFDEDYYRLYIRDFMKIPLTKGQDDKKFTDFIEMCQYFNQDILGFLCDKLVEILEQFKETTDDYQALNILKNYCNLRAYLITDDFDKEVLKEFENIEKTYISIKDLKVNLKSVNKKVKNKEEATEKLKNIWEEKMHPGAFTANDYQEIVTLSGGELIDAENLEIKNAKDALELLKIKLKIEEMYMQLDLNNETDIERMINYINEINSEKSKKVIGNHIYVFLMSLLNVKNTVCNYMVIHNNMQNDIENFKAGKFCESLIIEFNENGEIVFPQKYFEESYHCDDEERRSGIKTTIKNIGIKYNALDFKDEEVLLELKQRAQILYIETQLGGEFIEELEKRLNYLDRYERTVLGVLYDTKEEADRERKKVAGNEKYETEEEAKVARGELEIINSKIVGSYTALNLDTCIEPVRWLIQTEFKTLSGQNKKEKIKKNIVDQYTELCRVIDEYNNNKTQVKIWTGISIAATLIAVYLFFRTTLIGKIVLIIIDMALWGKVMELKENEQNYAVQPEEIKARVDDKLYINENTVCLKEESQKSTTSGIKCPECGMEIEKDMKFCPKCGKNLEMLVQENRCPKCGMEIEKDMKFCPKCGMKIEK